MEAPQWLHSRVGSIPPEAAFSRPAESFLARAWPISKGSANLALVPAKGADHAVKSVSLRKL
jgi:hypothetical protein